MENFTEQDSELCMKFGKFIGEHAKFNLSVPQLLEFHKMLVWYNSLMKKVDAHVMEVKSIRKMEKEEPKASE